MNLLYIHHITEVLALLALLSRTITMLKLKMFAILTRMVEIVTVLSHSFILQGARLTTLHFSSN